MRNCESTINNTIKTFQFRSMQTIGSGIYRQVYRTKCFELNYQVLKFFFVSSVHRMYYTCVSDVIKQDPCLKGKYTHFEFNALNETVFAINFFYIDFSRVGIVRKTIVRFHWNLFQ